VPGALVTAGTQAFRIDDLSNLVTDVQVVEVDINHVQIGQPATVTFDAIPNKTYNGKVLSIDLAGTSANTVLTLPSPSNLQMQMHMSSRACRQMSQ